MPQLSSRTDEAGWNTPAVDALLDESPPLPHSDIFRREQAAAIQQYLDRQSLPGRIIRVGAFPSHTFFVLRPGGRRPGPQPPVTVEDIMQQLPGLRDTLQARQLGLVPSLRLGLNDVGLIVRMAEHHPLHLRDLVLMKAFTTLPGHTALPLGLAVKQQVLVRDLVGLPHLLIFGDAPGAASALRSLLLTLALLNTPAELRIALVQLTTAENPPLGELVRLPHVLGQRMRSAVEGWRLLNGLAIEQRRRSLLFAHYDVPDLEAYNREAAANAVERLPRLLLVLDGLLDADWLLIQERWLAPLTELAAQGHQTGIHLFLTVHGDDEAALPEMLSVLDLPRLVLRSATGAARSL
ncbi:MAG: hypothetical protein JW910_13945, partial [Anaerolineae bacterium]|nr:hypothetical protein [Anaerolineae bacterium]